MIKVRISTATKKENSEVRNVEDLWEIFSKEDLERFQLRCRFFWKVLSNKYIYFLALVAIAPILMVVASVVLHFQFGYDIPWVDVKFHETAAHWGQLGDFVGGILNPLLSFVAFIAVLINLVLQRRDLSLAREEAKESNKTQKLQSRIFEKQNETVERQNFESTFFRLLDMHSQQFTSAFVELPDSGEKKTGADCFAWVKSRFLPVATYGEDVSVFVLSKVELYSRGHTIGMQRYFRSLHQILKFIDGYGNTSGLREGAMVGMRVRKSVRQYGAQRAYANMLRAQFSNDEQCCLFLNCLTEKGSGLKYYVEKYSFLKGVEFPRTYKVDDVRGGYIKVLLLLIVRK